MTGSIIDIIDRPWFPPATAFLVFGLLMWGMWALFDSAGPEYTVPPLGSGTVVTMKLDGRSGMVLWGRCPDGRCYYMVRFSAKTLETDVGLLGPDGPVVSGAYHDVYVNAFELAE